LLSLCC
jgi:predicted house-cleaning noncanonical NTP pyrophosphatase (MazG superfamily)